MVIQKITPKNKIMIGIPNFLDVKILSILISLLLSDDLVKRQTSLLIFSAFVTIEEMITFLKFDLFIFSCSKLPRTLFNFIFIFSLVVISIFK
ncbi:unknown [Clostridium sp. CAG:440]|nr:unknown [Clostridium sp. CAG:440]